MKKLLPLIVFLAVVMEVHLSIAQNVGIGTTLPAAKLHVYGGNITSEVRLSRVTSSHTHCIWSYNSPDVIFGPVGHDRLNFITDNLTRITIVESGLVGINCTDPNEQLSVVGNIRASGAVISATSACSSDERFKTDISPVSHALDKIIKLNGVYYYWNTAKFPERQFSNNRQIGFIAQEVETILPETVFTETTGYKAIDYGKITPLLVEAIKELVVQNEALRLEIDTLRNQVKNIQPALIGNQIK